jgi:tripartite-type tricarboxylate transporter receptor subunit TctC
VRILLHPVSLYLRFTFIAAAAGLAALFGSVAHAQNYPTKPVKMVVPFPPGGSLDIAGRLIAQKLTDAWGQSVVVENKPGAGGNIGADFVAKAAPDGHVLLMTATSFATTPALSPKLPFDPIRSFAPVVQIAASELTLVVHPQLPVRSMPEFIQLAKRRPGQLLYSSPGNGGPQHLTTELIKLETGIDIVHVPYKGATGAVTDLIGGHVQAMVSAMQTISPQVRGRKLRMLAVMGEKRSAAFPEVPTMKEHGWPNLIVETWYGLFAPAGTSSAVIAKLNADINALLQHADVRDSLARQDLNPVGGSPEGFADMVGRDLSRWARVVAAANIKPD